MTTTTNNQKRQRLPIATRFAARCFKVREQSGKRFLVNATRLWNYADSLSSEAYCEPGPLWAVLRFTCPAAFRNPAAVNSIRFTYWNRPAWPALPTLALPAALPFNCPRTCPAFETRDYCRFNSLLAAVGVRSVVTSETLTVDVKFRSVTELAAAVGRLGGSVIGFGSHELYQRDETTGKRQAVDGFGFRLPGWKFPLIATDGGALAFDNFGGRWGNAADIERLTAEYSLSAATKAADSLGWMNERLTVDGSALLRVYHPRGGYLDVTAGGVEANGFGGVGCHDAATELAAAMGTITATVPKAEFYNQQQQAQQLEQ